MFDYQAGEKYKLTLIMVGLAGLIAGMFFTLLLMPSGEAPARHRHGGGGQSQRVMSNPDITGHRDGGFGSSPSNESESGGGGGGGGQSGPGPSASSYIDKSQAQMFMGGWLPQVWDLSASSAAANQAEAMRWMTPDCAAAYQRNVWTPDLAKQVQESGLQSSFRASEINVSDNQSDGSVIVKVKGIQTLGANGKNKQRPVNLEYMLKQTPDGMRIAGISDNAANR
jgi:hypothetical protein